ncbi:hydroxymyristoyl-ACP dehydratase, partial [Salmonella enterica subsp. enterica serovar Infantis]
MTTNTHTLQIEEILELLPHRFPFLLVDRVLDFEAVSYTHIRAALTIANSVCRLM